MPSPTCTVNASSTTGGVNVSAASTITIQLASLDGVSTWECTCVGRDEVASAPTVSINTATKTATFTSGAAGSAYLFESRVNGGVYAGVTQPSYTTRLAIFVLTAGGMRVVPFELTTEANATVGWCAEVNAIIRRGDVATNLYGTIAAMPAAGVAGRRYTAHDGACIDWVDDGSEWRPSLGGGGLGYRPPLAATWTAANSGGGMTLTDYYGALLHGGATDTGTTTWRGYDHSVACSAGKWIEATFDAYGGWGSGTGWSEHGLYFRDSGSQKCEAFVYGFDHTTGALRLYHDYYSAYTTRASRTAIDVNLTGMMPAYMKILYSGGNIYMGMGSVRNAIEYVASAAMSFTPNKMGLFVRGDAQTPIAWIRHVKTGG